MGVQFRRRVLAPAVVGLAVVAVVAALAVAASGTTRPGNTGTSAVGAGGTVGPGHPGIEIIDAHSMLLADQIRPPATDQPQYVSPTLMIITSWVSQTATDPDPTTNPAVNKLTPRTAFMVDNAIRAGLTRLGSIGCVGGRASNPSSDHPGGRGCDLFYNHTTPEGVAAGWKAANWLVSNQSVLGVKYVIWQGLIWSASSRGGPWGVYNSAAYGCPDPANITGCHYDHVHVSMY